MHITSCYTRRPHTQIMFNENCFAPPHRSGTNTSQRGAVCTSSEMRFMKWIPMAEAGLCICGVVHYTAPADMTEAERRQQRRRRRVSAPAYAAFSWNKSALGGKNLRTGGTDTIEKRDILIENSQLDGYECEMDTTARCRLWCGNRNATSCLDLLVWKLMFENADTLHMRVA